MWTVRASWIVMASLGGIEANLTWPGTPEAATAPQDALHEAMAGENLHLIAGDYSGDARQWKRIWQAKPDQIPKPNRIRRGSLLRIADTVLPAESYTDFLTRAGRVVTRASGPARSEIGRPSEVEVHTSEKTPPASASPRMEPTTPPGAGAPTGPPRRPGVSCGPPAKRP